MPGSHPHPGRFHATTLRVVPIMAATVALQVGIGVAICRAIQDIDGPHFAAARDHARELWLAGTLLALACAVGIVTWSQLEARSRMRRIARAAEAVAAGDLHADLHLVPHPWDDEGRTVQALLDLNADLRELVDYARQIAGGDLTADLEPCSERDELRLALSRMSAGLRDIVGELHAKADVLFDVSEHVAAGAESAAQAVDEIALAGSEVAGGAGRQLQALAGARDRGRSVAAQSGTAAASARDVAAHAESARKMAEAGADSVEAAGRGMSDVREASTQATATIRALGERTSRIASMVDTIAGIAEQTHLLALNASTEAARAGEHGRGFAVVADQVRSLAAGSQDASRAIAPIIGNIRDQTLRAVEVVERGAESTLRGAASADAARESFGAISRSIEITAHRAATIADALRRIAEGSVAMADDLQGVADLAASSAGSAQRVSAATSAAAETAEQIIASARELSAHAADLRALATSFVLS